jgi:hypothetical protein
MNFDVNEETVLQVFKLRSGKDQRMADIYESVSWEAVAIEQAGQIERLTAQIEKLTADVEMLTAELTKAREVLADLETEGVDVVEAFEVVEAIAESTP